MPVVTPLKQSLCEATFIQRGLVEKLATPNRISSFFLIKKNDIAGPEIKISHQNHKH